MSCDKRVESLRIALTSGCAAGGRRPPFAGCESSSGSEMGRSPGCFIPGFRSLPSHGDPRFARENKFHDWKLRNFVVEGITSSSTDPLKVARYVALVTATGAFL